MRDDIFDKYLADIINNKSAEEKKDVPSGAVITDQKPDDVKIADVSGSPAGKNVDEETLDDFAEKTIRFSNGDLAQMTAAFKKSEAQALKPEETPKPRRRRRIIRKANYSAYGGIVLATLVLCTSLIISLFVIVVGRDFLGIDTNNNMFTLYIESGSDLNSIAKLLEENGVIQYPEVFVRFARLKIGGDSIYPGDIDVMPSMSYGDIIDSLMEMREAHPTVTVTFIEGSTIDSAAKVLEENGVCSADEFIFAFNTNVYGFDFESYVGSSSLKFYKYEGYLFPDTYEFYEGDSVYNIVKKIKERTSEILSADVIRKCNEMGYTLDQIVTLASILQLESGDAAEMKNIAGVFYNRLNNPSEYPRLQSDTTYRYIENVIKAGSTIAYPEMYDAYDTYVCTGLPVGAICNPGEAAIQAALNPNENNDYFFLSDSEGNFYYAATYQEHLANAEIAGINVNG